MAAHLDGRIVSAGFASGDRFVIGDWRSTPIGPMNDVMWARADGERVLLAPEARFASIVELRTSVAGGAAAAWNGARP